MKNIRFIFCLVFILGHLESSSFAQIRLPKLISDGMILQRNTPLNLWGWASPKEKVTLHFGKQNYETQTDENGKWLIKLPSQPVGGPHELVFEASNKITLKDVRFGDVWLCSGQSNMELMMERVADTYPTVMKTANNLQIRQFTVPDVYDFGQQRDDVSSGQWVSVSPKSIHSFSAVAYFFADHLYQKYHVPIGLINSALGGSPVQAWMSEEALQKFPKDLEEGIKFRDKKLIDEIEANNRKINGDWYKQLNASDEGLKNKWHSPNLDDSSWPQMQVPNFWATADANIKTGSVWFRKHLDLPPSFAGQSARLFLGRIVDADSVFVNGQFVGTTSYQYPPRKYNIPQGLLKEKNNVISVRIINSAGRGGFILDKPYQLIFATDTLSLKGLWQYKVGTQQPPMADQVTVRWKPTGLYNAMIAPLTPYAIKGTIWYQGESNTGNPSDYQALMATMIQRWRSVWQQGDFPFLFVQLANFMESKPQPSESKWAVLREAQRQTLAAPNTAMAVIIDIGEWNDVHPLNKKEVGKRLALQAQKLAYGDKKVVASGPMVKSLKITDNKAFINFSETGSGLTTLNNLPLKGFAIAGADKKFVWANAKIKGKTVEIWSDAIDKPMYIRYAWADNPTGVNLYNKEGLPASPFEIH